MQLTNSVAIVTGGASGLGFATAQAFIAKGARVALFDLNEETGAAAAKELGENARFCRVNVSDEASVQAGLADVVAAWGGVHIAVNCAGIGSAMRTVGRNGPHSLDVFSKVIAVNLIGTFNVTRLAAAEMAKNEGNADNERGVIINTASVAAFDGQIGQAAYSASKGGVVGMTLPLARDLASIGVRVNTIAPGIFNTPLLQSSPDSVKLPLIEMTQFPKRLGLPSEYAQLAAQLVENAFMNGETIRIDGAIRMAPR
ncbi:3-hydroxyacyl-CoA dehydrogenase [Paraperlucidibaca wandonensis]|jgi:3-hydroxyacyl-CoA dehydrogenase/3-hydroxy-2-methylbutyryl-CoA dehydrogenase|uniref:3-hydroxyacyl-CoA dehydrogenase n=1 Tax=Paraperlucidibaca wandonensis TaxID=1268273 RepID=A0ABW3HBK9_9GAMM|nr:3-hydroxyacyl-CoA dehydrogenase [Paraperlucidibaca sp.]MBQ0723395.1 3-hydroxyacyl-CoA dehydrogenase [Paraperlucidibaca sp.]MBQ0842939.1 3-hydroxyacyl-CoA dehydrogenase [Paraperlucidibaca sp.]|tara:strand:- start:714 stop:1481 length:768 start_codon:yes stop_codon:yes gene_type:complete